MDEVKHLINRYKTLQSKTEFIRDYFECISIAFKKSSDIFLRASQIPRDTEWKDANLINLVELGEKQKEIYFQTYNTYTTLFKDIESLLISINEEILLIETNLSKLIKQDEQSHKELEKAKELHFDSWDKNKDPWITDIKLKLAIKNLYSHKENNFFLINNMSSMYNDKYLNTQDLYNLILKKLCKEQNILYRELSDVSVFNIKNKVENEKYFDTFSTSKEDLNNSKIIDTYEEIIYSLNKDLCKKNINIFKNIEPLDSGLFKIKKGLTGEWTLVFVAVTKSKFIHFFNIYDLSKVTNKYLNFYFRLKSMGNKSLSSIFDSKKSILNSNEEKLLGHLNQEILINIDKLIDNLYLTLNLHDKIFKLEKDKNIISIGDKMQTSISNLLGLNVLKIKAFNLGSCYELYFAIKKKEIVETVKTNENKIDEVPLESYKNVVIKITEENPWKD